MTTTIFAGADENTPSLAQYFSWINHTNEGPTESHTLANLAFFQWMHDTFGMQLDIYAFDAGAIDGAGFYGSMKSERYKRQFPNGFGPIAEAAAKFGCRLGIWGGPDGFGDTEEEARERIEQMVSLCRDHKFQLFKFDSVCGRLRPEKVKYFIEMMTECRKYAPDLILLNHRLDLGEGLPHATTFLWEGREMYTDVYNPNPVPGIHNRVGEISRGLPPELRRLTEDHGVCLSSSLDYWEDSLIQQAFNRALILAPEIYGSPWLLRDDEFPRLARIYNLHRRYRDILVNGNLLPEEPYGEDAVSRGDACTRFLSLRNLGWERSRVPVTLDETTGLAKGDRVQVRRMHPYETILGEFRWGETVDIDIEPFRACLVLVSTAAIPEIGFHGCEGEVIKDKAGEDAVVKLYGLPGTSTTVKLSASGYASALCDGEDVSALLSGGGMKITFAGEPVRQHWHRKLADLKVKEVPDDALGLYEATVFSADNNALEVRCLDRSGPTAIPQVQAARDAFFEQDIFRERGLWDRHLFDDAPDTFFAVSRRHGDLRTGRMAALRLDFGEALYLDKLVFETANSYNMQPINNHEAVRAYVSTNLRDWSEVSTIAAFDIVFNLDPAMPIRYFKIAMGPERVNAVKGYRNGELLDRSGWRASNLFAHEFKTEAAWSATVKIDQVFPGSYLVVPVFGPHVPESVYAGARCGDEYLGASRRAAAYPANPFECPAVKGKCYSYFIPLEQRHAGKEIEVCLLGNKDCAKEELASEVWVTAYPTPHEAKIVTLCALASRSLT
jgi:ribosomal protein L21E